MGQNHTSNAQFLHTGGVLKLSLPTKTFVQSIKLILEVQYFFPVSFHFITHNLISELIWFVLFVYMDYFGCYQHLVKISCQQHF